MHIIASKINPKIFLLISLIILIPVVMLMFSFVAPPSSNQKPPISTFPTQSLKPTFPPNTPTMSIIRSAPRSIDNTFYLPPQPIELTFTENVLPNGIIYNVSPFVETEVTQGSLSNVLVIAPVKSWIDGETTITITTETTATNGARLHSDFIYIMRSALPPAPQGEGTY